MQVAAGGEQAYDENRAREQQASLRNCTGRNADGMFTELHCPPHAPPSVHRPRLRLLRIAQCKRSGGAEEGQETEGGAEMGREGGREGGEVAPRRVGTRMRATRDAIDALRQVISPPERNQCENEIIGCIFF